MQAVQKQQKLPRDKKLSADKYHLLKSDERKRNMKSKFGFIRVLAVVFALVLSISLVSCVKDEDLDSVKTDAGKTQENVNQLQTDTKALQDKLDALTTEVKALTDTAATKSALEDALNQLKTLSDASAAYNTELEAVKTKLSEVEGLSTNYATKTALEEAETALNNAIANKADATALADAKTALEKAISDLNKELYGENGNGGKFAAVSAEIKAVSDDLENYAKKADLTALTTRVAALETWKNSFEDKKYLNDYIDFTKQLKDETYQYSVKNFWDSANEVAEGPYDDEEIKEFNKKIDSIALFLARAVTETDAKWCFDQLAAAKEALKTLDQTLKEKLDNFTVIANNDATKEAYNNIVKAYEKLYAKDPAAATAMTRYTLIKAAYENFFGTETATGAVAAGKTIQDYVTANLKNTTIVLGTSDATVKNAGDQFAAFKTDYFSNADWNELYGIVKDGKAVNASSDVVAASLANGLEIQGYAKRIELLNAAKTYADAQLAMKFNWNAYMGTTDVSNERPLYDNETNAQLLAKINAWSKDAAYKSDADYGTYTGCTNDIEEENIKAILGADAYEDLLKSVDYAAAMLKIYTEFITVDDATLNVKQAIIDEIVKLTTGKVVIDATNDAAMKKLQDLIKTMDNKIEAVADYNAESDGNKLYMVAQNVRDNAQAFVNAYKTVTDAIAAIETELYPDGDIAKMKFTSFKQYAKIEAFKTTVETACETLKTTLSATSVTAPEAVLYVDGELQDSCLLAKLYAAYNSFTAEAWDAYKSANEAIKAVEENGVKLDMGNQIKNAFTLILNAVAKFGIAPSDMIVPKAGEGVEPVNFHNLQNRLDECLKQYKVLAEAAEVVAAEINTAIDALADLDTTDLNNYKQIVAVMNKFTNDWLRKVDAEGNTVYFTKDITVEDALTLTQNVVKQGSLTETYKFVDTGKYNNTLKVKYNAMVATYEAAKTVIEAWKTSATEVMAETMTIHTIEYVTVYNNYSNVTAYYKSTALGNDNQLFGEYTLYTAFKTEYDKYITISEAATAKANEIRTKIEALPAIDTIDLTNYTTVKTSVEEIKSLYEAYTETYCDGVCQFTVNGANNTSKKDYLLILAKVEGVVNYLEDTVTENVATDKINEQLANLVSALGVCDNIDTAEYYVNYFTEQAILSNGSTTV